MRRNKESISAALLGLVALVACGSAQSTPADPSAPSETPAAKPSEVEPSASPSDAAAGRPDLTAEVCEAGGGTVVGDIGDGATQRPGYRCPSGAEPTGNIRAPEGGPIGVEGSVCCPK
jgi:hypothetical protein